ncbi:MOSC domain-containing protein [soil metagenome]
MKAIGTVESLWRYPVKSMRGEEPEAVFVGFAGVYCDRLFAFHSNQSRPGLPYLTAREQRQMLRFQPRFRKPENAVAPANLSAAGSLGSGATPLYADADALALEVETPNGMNLAIDDPALSDQLCDALPEKPQLTLLRSERALTDCRPVSLISLQTVAQLGEETGGAPLERRRFRANLYLDLTTNEGFHEDAFVGRSLRVGAQTTLAILQRDSRCMIITLDPETGETSPAVLKAVAQNHGGFAGVYAAVLVEGMVRQDDEILLLD